MPRHTTSTRPVPAETPVRIRFRNGVIDSKPDGSPRLAGELNWSQRDYDWDVADYRVTGEKA